jgi:hypothetical protein
MPTVKSFTSGDTVRFSITFAIAGVGTDPSTSIAFRIRNPNKVVTSYVYITDAEVVRDDAGDYHVDLALSLPGEYWYRWEGVGTTAPGVSEGRVKILHSMVTG